MYDFLDKIGLKTVLEAIKGKLESYALKSLYGDTTINVGRKAGTTVGDNSTAEGYNTTASGTCSHAEGSSTTASGAYSHAEGSHTTASGYASHAEGADTVASGDYSHAEGVATTASGNYSHAEGWATTASGEYSYAGGNHTTALHDNEVSYGKYNESKYNTLFSIGDGTADDARHNAFEITTTGGILHDGVIITQNKISNPNLLINSDFKINQRLKSGTITPNTNAEGENIHTYFVDRWGIDSGSVTINADGTLTLNGVMSQILENSVGANVTASFSGGMAAYNDKTKTFTITGYGVVISWAKLEIGSVATPFVTPDPVEELRKCQRYYRIITNTMIQPYMYYANLLLYFIPIHDMREDDNNDIAPIVTVSGTINDFSGIVIYDYYGGTKVGDIDTIDASFPKGWGVYLNAHTVFNPSGLSGTLRIADGAKITIDAEIY